VAVALDGGVPEGIERDADREDGVVHPDVADNDEGQSGPHGLLEPAAVEEGSVQQKDGDLDTTQCQGVKDDIEPFGLQLVGVISTGASTTGNTK